MFKTGFQMEMILAVDQCGALLREPPGGEDMNRFVALTWGKRCVAGARTANTLGAMRGREIVIATRLLPDGDVVIGGDAVYRSYLAAGRIHRVYLSRFKGSSWPVCGEPIALDGLSRQVCRSSVDHDFEIWTT